MADELVHGPVHPARVHERQLAVLGDGRGVGVQERVAHLGLRHDGVGDHAVEAGVDLADQLLDQCALARRRPALHQHDHPQLRLQELLLLGEQLFPKPLQLRLERLLVLRRGLIEILEH